jgi:hypothetical protein
LTVARKIAQERGQPDWLQVKDWAEAASPHAVCTDQVDHDGPVLVVTTLRHGRTTSLVIDGYAKIFQAHAQQVGQLDCVLLTQEDAELVKVV